MPRPTVKNYHRVSLSLGTKTILRGDELVEKYSNWRRQSKPMSRTSRTELYELALNLGFSILEPIAKREGWSELEDVRKIMSTIAKKSKARTVGDLTDEELEKLEIKEIEETEQEKNTPAIKLEEEESI